MIRKEAGTIAYQLREIKDLGREANEENPSVAVSVVGGRTVTADELAKEIAASCTIKEADVAGVLKALSLRVQRTLLNGDRVELGEIGTLSVTLTCGNKRKEDHITSKDISVSRIAFTPCAELWHSMRGAVIVSGGPTGNKKLSDEVIMKRLEEYFATSNSMSRSTFERVCECSRHTALTKLKELTEQGILIAIGPKNLRQYVMSE